MALEIERKFLVKSNEWELSAMGIPTFILQGYLSSGLRVRIKRKENSTTAFITIKEKTDKVHVRQEFEYEIPVADANKMMKIAGTKGHLITKYRWDVQGGWEVDVFYGKVHQGLVLAEFEMTRSNQKIVLPKWIGKEVTHMKKYSNSSLFKNGT